MDIEITAARSQNYLFPVV